MSEKENEAVHLSLAAEEQPTLEQQHQQMQEEEKGQSKDPNRPEWLPDKFKSAEDMAKSYSELEQKMGGQEEAIANLEIKPGEGKETTAGGLSMDDLAAYGEEWNANGGSLKEESYTALEGRGISREVVQAFVQAQQAQSDAERATTLAEAGLNTDAWTMMSGWAADNWSEDQISQWNQLASSSNPMSRKLAVTHLKDAFNTGRGQGSGQQLEGVSNSSNGLTPFRSSAEMLEAMKDPRYDKDPAFRDDIDRRTMLGLQRQ